MDVEDLDALAKLAKRCALLIFHWSDDAGDLYFVQDETAMYRCLVARAPQPDVRTGHESAWPRFRLPLESVRLP